MLILVHCRSVSDAIYSGIPGANLTTINGLGDVYILPCGQEINITFVFSGQKYPIHPLDTNMNGTRLGISDGTGKDICFGAVSITRLCTSPSHLTIIYCTTVPGCLF